MTGPGEGKIEIGIKLFIDGRNIPCTAYIHVRGYSRATVTHLDLEGFTAKSNESRVPAVVVGGINEVTVILMRDIEIDGISGRKLKIKGISLLSKGKKSGAYVGIKEGGIYIGFRKEIIEKLEEIARKLRPDLFSSGGADISTFIER